MGVDRVGRTMLWPPAFAMVVLSPCLSAFDILNFSFILDALQFCDRVVGRW
jgi:hypothetical protein